MNTTVYWKRHLGSLGLGALVLGVVYSFVVFVSADMRLVYAIGAILLLCSAIWMRAKGKANWLTPAFLSVHAELRDESDIEFVVVASDVDGDTPERLKSFAQRHITLPLAYYPGGKAHKAFGLTGVPTLVVLDRMGRMRFTHEGYNASEMNFRRDLVQFLKTL